MKKRTVFLVIHFFSAMVFAEDIYREEADLLKTAAGYSIPEAPPSLFSWKINDREVDLFSSGTWSMALENGGLTIGFSDGMESVFQKPVFTQTVDFTLSLTLDKRWYFESSFADNFDKNTFAAGYHGRSTDIIQEFRIGNSGLFFPDIFTFVSGSAADEDTGTDTWGVSASFGHHSWKGWLIAKIENTAYEEMTFSGTNEITQSEIAVSNYVQAKWFYLPGMSANRNPISVYVETPSGNMRGSDGHSYRKLDPAEYLFSPTTGMMTLKQKTTRRVAVAMSGSDVDINTYINSVTSLFNSGTDIAPATNINTFMYQASGSGESGNPGAVSLSIGGTDALLVYVHGYFNPMLAAHMYALPGTYSGSKESSFSLVWTETSTTIFDVNAVAVSDAFSAESSGMYIEVATNDTHDTVAKRLFPLTAYSKKMYLPASDGKTSLPVTLECTVYTEKSAISLGSDVSPSTITVYRDGVQDSAFTFDVDSGVLTLSRAPFDGEYIKVTFSRTTAESNSVMLNSAVGVQWKPGNPVSPWEIKSAASVQWDISGNSYADETVSYPGSMLVSAETAYNSDTITAGTAFAGGLYTDNSSGWYRILGMDSNEYTVYYGHDWFYPVPDGVRAYFQAFTNLPPLKSDDMLSLVYRDTVMIDALTNVTVTSLTNLDRAAIQPGDSPYAASDSEVSGFVMAVEWDEGNTEEDAQPWLAAEIHGQTMPDYSGTRQLQLALKSPVPSQSNSYDVYLQLGISDDDAFDATGTTTRIQENTKNIQTWRLTGKEGIRTSGVTAGFDSTIAGWQIINITLSETERNALTAGTGARIVVIPKTNGGSWSSGSLAVGPIESHSSSFANHSESNATSWITPDPNAGTAAALTAHKNADIIERFNNSTSNRVLCIDIPAAISGKSVCSRYFSEVDTAAYNTLGFFVYAEKDLAADDSLTITLGRADNSDVGITVQIPADCFEETGSWHNVTVDLEKQTVAIDGSVRDGASVSGITSANVVSRITISATTTDSQRFYLDEIYLSGSNINPRIQNKSWFTWKQNVDPAKKSGKTHISNAYVSLIATPDINWHNSDTPAVSTTGTIETGANIFGYKISAEGGVFSENSEVLPKAGHSVSGSTGPFSISEEYAFNLYQNTFRRNFSAGLSAAPIVPLQLKAATTQSGSPTVSSTATSYSIDFSSKYVTSFFSAALSEVAAGSSLTGETYGSQWLTTWQQIIDGNDKRSKNRLSKFANATSFIFGDTSVILDTAAQSEYTGNVDQENANSFEWKLSVPTEIKKWNLTPYYQRIASDKILSNADNSWQNDIDTYLQSPPMNISIITLIPFYEFFDEKFTDTVSNTSGEYKKFASLFGVQWSRPSSSGLSDFFIPSSVDMALGRTAITEGADTSDLLSVTAKIAGTALNMFGAYGAHNLFSFYTQDEFYRMYTAKAEFNGGYLNFDISTYHAAKFILDKSNKIESDNTFIYSRQQSGIEVSENNTTEIADATWKEMFSTIWTHKGINSPLTSLFSFLFSSTGEKNQANDGSTFSSPYWQAVSNAPLQTLRKESLTVIVGSSNDVFYSGEIKHSVEVTAAYVTMSASLALGFGKTTSGVLSATLLAGIGCTIQF